VGIPLPDCCILVIGGGMEFLLYAPLPYAFVGFGHAHVIGFTAAPCPIGGRQTARGLQIHADADVAGGLDSHVFVVCHGGIYAQGIAAVNMRLAFIFALCILLAMNKPKSIGDKLVQARAKLGMTQTEFAKYFNVNQSTLHRWETGSILIGNRTEFWIEHVLGQLAFVYADRRKNAE
jgi:DNA-binding XRE family transcriptional regulator